MRFITDYFRLNQKLFRKPYPLPIINKNIQQLEGLQYDTTLYINMGYYAMRLSSASQDMTTIVTEFGKFRYNHLPMGTCTLGYIVQDKVDKLQSDIEGIKTYINDIIVSRKDLFTNHIEQLRIIFGRLCTSGLKVNTPMCSFGLKEIPHLGYVITREGIKNYLKKVQGIMDLGQPNTTTEA